MGARQSKRSVDITTTPKKGDNDTASVKEDKIEKLGDADVEVVTNGTAAHTDIEFADKDEAKEAKEVATPEVKENGLPESSDGEKTPDTEAVTAPAAGDQPATAETAEKITENGEKAAETPDAKKPKDKKKKKWSLRSISFSKKDKSKPGKEKEKNGEVEEVNEEKEEETAKTPEEVKPEETKAEESKTEETKSEEPAKTPEVETPAVEAKVEEPVVAPVEQTPVEATKEEEKPKPVEQEETTTKVEKVEETTTVQSEEVKEVRNEELPPPLPSSNPPSQVAVFAESLKDNVITSNETTSSPVVESQCPSETQPVTVEAPIGLELKTEAIIEASESAAKSESSSIVNSSIIKESSPVEASIVEASESEVKTEPVTAEALVNEASEAVNKLESSPEDTAVIEASESSTKIESPPVEIPVIESPPQISEPSNESPPEILSKSPPEEVSQTESPEGLPETPPVIPSAEEVKVAENESINSKTDPDIAVESSETLEEEKPKLNELCDIDIPSAGDSPPFVIENLSNVSSVTTTTTLSTQQSETSNLAEAESKLEIKIEDQESSESVSSVPVVIEEQLPVVSSAGDVPNPLDSHTSCELNDDNNLQEIKSNLNLKESSISQESNQLSEDASIDLSIIPEAVESIESKIEESKNIPELTSPVNVELNETTNSIVEQQDSPKVEPLCNADSLADLSTESLPSLPEPSDSVLEPMSLPPLDFLPDPLVDDNLPVESPPVTKPNETEPQVVLTNGKSTNGLKSSPTADDDDTPPLPPPDGPLKQQVIAPESTIEACEISQTTEEKADTVEVQSEAQ